MDNNNLTDQAVPNSNQSSLDTNLTDQEENWSAVGVQSQDFNNQNVNGNSTSFFNRPHQNSADQGDLSPRMTSTPVQYRQRTFSNLSQSSLDINLTNQEENWSGRVQPMPVYFTNVNNGNSTSFLNRPHQNSADQGDFSPQITSVPVPDTDVDLTLSNSGELPFVDFFPNPNVNGNTPNAPNTPNDSNFTSQGVSQINAYIDELAFNSNRFIYNENIKKLDPIIETAIINQITKTINNILEEPLQGFNVYMNNQGKNLNIADGEFRRNLAMFMAMILDNINDIINEDLVSTRFYKPAIKSILNDLYNPKKPIEERINTMELIKTCLGDCATPVKSFLMQKGLSLVISEGGRIDDEIRPYLEREALLNKINKEFKNELVAKREGIELAEAMVSLVFSSEFISKQRNGFQIEGYPTSIKPKSIFTNIGLSYFSKMNDLRNKFCEMLIKKNEDGSFKTGKNGALILDRKKLENIVNQYLATFGIVSDIERLKNDFKNKIEEILSKYPEVYADLENLDKIDPNRWVSELEIKLNEAEITEDLENIEKEFLKKFEQKITELNSQLEQPDTNKLEQSGTKSPTSSQEMAAPREQNYHNNLDASSVSNGSNSLQSSTSARSTGFVNELNVGSRNSRNSNYQRRH